MANTIQAWTPQNPETRNQNPESRNQKQETRNQKPETKNPYPHPHCKQLRPVSYWPFGVTYWGIWIYENKSVRKMFGFWGIFGLVLNDIRHTHAAFTPKIKNIVGTLLAVGNHFLMWAKIRKRIDMAKGFLRILGFC